MGVSVDDFPATDGDSLLMAHFVRMRHIGCGHAVRQPLAEVTAIPALAREVKRKYHHHATGEIL
jgi:hypothetical protein